MCIPDVWLPVRGKTNAPVRRSPTLRLFYKYSELVVSCLFAVDWLFRLWLTDARVSYIVSSQSIVDLLSILPAFIALGTGACPSLSNPPRAIPPTATDKASPTPCRRAPACPRTRCALGCRLTLLPPCPATSSLRVPPCPPPSARVLTVSDGLSANTNLQFLRVLRLLRALRILRFYRLIRYSDSEVQRELQTLVRLINCSKRTCFAALPASCGCADPPRPVPFASSIERCPRSALCDDVQSHSPPVTILPLRSHSSSSPGVLRHLRHHLLRGPPHDHGEHLNGPSAPRAPLRVLLVRNRHVAHTLSLSCAVNPCCRTDELPPPAAPLSPSHSPSTAAAHGHPRRNSFHDGIYFVVITICTVGYGAGGETHSSHTATQRTAWLASRLSVSSPAANAISRGNAGDITPTNNISRLVILATLGVTFVLLPIRFAKLNEVLNQQSPYLRVKYHPTTKRHVVVTGHVTAETLVGWLSEFFHEARPGVNPEKSLGTFAPPWLNLCDFQRRGFVLFSSRFLRRTTGTRTSMSWSLATRSRRRR